MDQQIMITNKNNDILRRMNRDSQTILSKNKPQVRIIHIFAPEIIKTDPANFRELVQRLTGKPSSTREKMIGKKSKKSFTRTDDKRSDNGSSVDGSSVERVKSEPEAADKWRSSSSSGGSGDNDSGGFLSEFADMEDGFMQQLGMFQPSNLDTNPNHQNPLLMRYYNHYYTHHPQRQHQQQQQQQHHFFGEEDHTDHNRVI